MRNHYFMIRIRIKARTDPYPLNTGRRTLAKSGRISHLSISTSSRVHPSPFFLPSFWKFTRRPAQMDLEKWPSDFLLSR